MIGVFAEPGEHLHLTGKQALLVWCQRLPVLDAYRFRRKFRIGRHDTQLLLPRQRLVTQSVPSLVELAAVFVDPFPGHLVRRMDRPGGEVDEEWFVRRKGLLVLDPADRLVRHIGHQVIAWIMRNLDPRKILVQRRDILVGLAAHEAVELVEAGAGRPEGGGAGGADVPGRRLVPLAKRRRAVTVQPQRLGKWGNAVRTHAGVARESGGGFGDRAQVVDVVVTAGEQGRPCRRAQRRRMELIVTKTARWRARRQSAC